MKDILKRLSSRKFLVTVGGIFAVTVYPAYADHIVQLIVAYNLAEGSADVVQRYSQSKFVDAPVATVKATNSFFTNPDDEDDVDKNQEPVPGQ